MFVFKVINVSFFIILHFVCHSISFICFSRRFQRATFSTKLYSDELPFTSQNGDLRPTTEEEINEERKIAALLRQQGITMDDLKSLREAVVSGKRYNKRSVENIPKPPPVSSQSPALDTENDTKGTFVAESMQENHPVQTSTSNVEPSFGRPASIRPTNRISYTNAIFPAGVTLSSSTNSLERTMTENSTNSTHTKLPSATAPRKRIQIVVKKSRASSISSPDKAAVEDRQKIMRPSPTSVKPRFASSAIDVEQAKSNFVSLDGLKLETILTELVEKYGFEELYERVNLRCFVNKPTLKSSLKVLRQEEAMWARKAIEKLYIEMKKQ